MIHLVLYTHVSLHEKNAEARAALVEEIRAQLRCPLERKVWHVEAVVHGNYFLPDGRPRRRDADNQIYTVFNCLAKAGGLDDSYLNRSYSVRVEQGDEYVELTLT